MILKTNRFILREYTFDDAQTIYDLIKDPEIYKYMHWGPNSKEDTDNHIKMAIDAQKEIPRISYEMLITDKSNAEVIGAAGIRVTKGSNREGSCGYWIKKDLWGRGIATEVTQRIIQLGFEEMKLNKISATAMPQNIGSIKVLEKVGMKKEGLLRDNIFAREKFHDSALLAILRKDYL